MRIGGNGWSIYNKKEDVESPRSNLLNELLKTKGQLKERKGPGNYGTAALASEAFKEVEGV